MKLHVNSVISDIKSEHMCMDVRYFYLDNRMNRADSIMIQISMIPQQLIIEYYLKYMAHTRYIFELVTKGIYRLPQSGIVEHDSLVQHLVPYL